MAEGEEMEIGVIALLVAWLPIYALMWLGHRNERIQTERLLRETSRQLELVRLSRGGRS